MILVDSSVWIDFFRAGRSSARLGSLLEDDRVLLHSWVLGELTLGRLGRRRKEILADLALLPVAPLVAERELVDLIEARRLQGRGIGWVDVGLLASALVGGAGLWTLDRRLAALAAEVGVALD